VEAWADEAAFRSDPDAAEPGAGLYTWKATGGVEPTPVDDLDGAVIIIDLFRIWRPVVGPVSAFNIRNSEAFNRQPGCISTTVFRGIGTGAIATYARWRSVEDFAAAFSKLTNRRAADTDGVNYEAKRMTFGMIRPDYHSYELITLSADVK
jgi:heme-degrading monooxygenase HmoA